MFSYILKIFFYFKNIFYHVTLENIFKILNNSVYFQNIVVFNKPLRTPFYRTPLDDCFWLNKSDLHSFADDNTIAVTCSNLNDLLRILNIQIDLLCICLLRAFARWRTNQILEHVYMRPEVNSNRLEILLWDKILLWCEEASKN